MHSIWKTLLLRGLSFSSPPQQEDPQTDECPASISANAGPSLTSSLFGVHPVNPQQTEWPADHWWFLSYSEFKRNLFFALLLIWQFPLKKWMGSVGGEESTLQILQSLSSYWAKTSPGRTTLYNCLQEKNLTTWINLNISTWTAKFHCFRTVGPPKNLWKDVRITQWLLLLLGLVSSV